MICDSRGPGAPPEDDLVDDREPERTLDQRRADIRHRLWLAWHDADRTRSGDGLTLLQRDVEHVARLLEDLARDARVDDYCRRTGRNDLDEALADAEDCAGERP